ncbi:MAG: RNA polymerase factor sigma-54 [Opitutales bacterium]|nr:RNA polymerase factor sigma-54 [Opitutales bacterium]
MASQGFQQVQKLKQSLVLAPQLRQSLKILQVPALELRNVILEELQSNPILEELAMDEISLDDPRDSHDSESDESSEERREPEPSEGNDDLEFRDDFSVLQKLNEDWQEYYQQESGEATYTSEDAQRRQHFFDSLTGDTSLQEQLMEQARMSDADEETLKAMEYLIGSLDDHGFLTSSLPDISLLSQIPLRKVQEAATLLRSLEPIGIGAADIRECLLLQLRHRGEGNSIAASIVMDHWALLLRRRLPEIARKIGVSTESVQEALDEIARLDPAPGRKLRDDSNQIIEPDVTVEKDENGEWSLTLNNDYIPRLRLSARYKEMLAQGVLRGKDREYVQEKFRSGRFLISSIEQRQQTIERITRELLKVQEEFFEEGTSRLRPLTMNQVAEAVGVHETTVSRAIANKYIRTPHGVFDFKYFFTPGYQGSDGQAVSNKSVKERIARIIESESSAKPLSDQNIVEILSEEGVKIARRTVAKYREELGILPTNLRRQYS